MITQNELKQCLKYDPITGKFTRTKTSRVSSDGTVGTVQKKGYRSIYVKNKAYAAHRLVWLYVHGCWPKDQIDHINGNRDDNRVENLREVTNSENTRNRRNPQGSNPYLGVTKKRWRSGFRWCARIMLNGKSKHIGYFKTAEAAKDAYLNMKKELHKIGI